MSTNVPTKVTSVEIEIPLLEKLFNAAWKNKDIELVIEVLKNRNIPVEWARNALTDAAAWGWTKMVQAILELPERFRPEPGWGGNLALIQTLAWGYWDVAGVLLAYDGPGAIRVLTEQGNPSSLAVTLSGAEHSKNGSEGYVDKALMKRGVDPNHPLMFEVKPN